MKYIASENKESQIGFYSQVRLFPQESKHVSRKKQMEYQKASPESRQVWSSGKTLLDLP